MRLTLSAPCYEPSQTVTVFVVGPPRAGIGMVAAFDGFDESGVNTIGKTDGQGRFHWSFPVPPTTRPGKGYVGAALTGPDWEDGGGEAHANFRVAPAGGC